MRKIDTSQIHIVNAAYRPLYDSPGYSKPGPGERDEPFVHFFQFDVAANQLLNKMPAQVDPDADFLWRSTVAVLVDTEIPPGDCKIQFQDPWLNLIESDVVISAGINGAVQPSPRHPEVLIPGNGVFYVTVQEYTGAGSTFFLAAYGVKRFKC